MPNEIERVASRRPSRDLVNRAIQKAEETRPPLTADEWKAEESLDNGDPIAFPRNSLRHMACCDCGLVHLVNVTHVLDDYVIVTFTRDDAATALARKGRHPEIRKRDEGVHGRQIERWMR
jgi:hypothetical protein